MPGYDDPYDTTGSGDPFAGIYGAAPNPQEERDRQAAMDMQTAWQMADPSADPRAVQKERLARIFGALRGMGQTYNAGNSGGGLGQSLANPNPNPDNSDPTARQVAQYQQLGRAASRWGN
jgi:hypothetical protein